MDSYQKPGANALRLIVFCNAIADGIVADRRQMSPRFLEKSACTPLSPISEGQLFSTAASQVHSHSRSLPINRIRNLAEYENSSYSPGRGILLRTIWYVMSLILFESGWFPSSSLKRTVLRIFGAEIGRGVVIKPHVRIKYPWRLEIGDHCWIGQDVWIDNLDQVTLESDVCVSQGAYLCTGSHDHRSPRFELKTLPIRICHGAWVAAKCIVLPGTIIDPGTVVSAGTVIDPKRQYIESEKKAE
ncbi:MAG: WcaF family extracellular polysaccharide biosynthesis acetyltransferase [Planctomycetaceae bacterium]|nr:WcaF family extracellular polysaccharide biosynthesis acetyltransferase [Planctomycetaceae bacterium]